MKSLSKWVAGAMLACTILTSVGATAASAEGARDSKPAASAEAPDSKAAPSAERWWKLAFDCLDGTNVGTVYNQNWDPIGTFNCMGLVGEYWL